MFFLTLVNFGEGGGGGTAVQLVFPRCFPLPLLMRGRWEGRNPSKIEKSYEFSIGKAVVQHGHETFAVTPAFIMYVNRIDVFIPKKEAWKICKKNYEKIQNNEISLQWTRLYS